MSLGQIIWWAAAWTVAGFIFGSILMWLDGDKKQAGPLTWLAILIGGPSIWLFWLMFTIAAHRRSNRSPLAQLERELKSKPRS